MNEIEKAFSLQSEMQQLYIQKHENKITPDMAEGFGAHQFALREKQEREKGCRFCNNPDNVVKIATEDGVTLASYCPRCGRRLEEAKKDV